MVSKQRGITMMSFVLVLVVIIIFSVLAMNLFPVYREGFSVQQAMESVAEQPGAQNMSVGALRKALQKRFDIDYVTSVDSRSLVLERDSAGNKLRMTYEVRKPMVYNIDFVAMFDYEVQIGAQASTNEASE